MRESVLFPKQELGKLLAKYRISAKLSQAELAKRIGFSKKRGYCHISQLETGKEKRPSLHTILLYLKACQVPWPRFFQELSAIDFKIEHRKIIEKVELPSSLTSTQRKKVDRDTAKYLSKIQYPKTPYQRLDWKRIREKVDKKVKILLFNHQIPDNQKAPYLKYAQELIDNYDGGQIKLIYEKYYHNKELHRGAIIMIRSIVYKTVRAEQKRLERQKALPSEKFRKMAAEFLKYRVKIELIEAEVQKLLGQLNVPLALNQAYKSFTRECYKTLRKYHQDPSLLKQKLADIKRWWIENKLDTEVLEKVKEIVVKYFPEVSR